jgi:hypothetical protein
MATRIQVRRDTAANWRTSGSTTLAAGEIGFETDTLLFKIGDGSQTWTNLEYAGGTEPIQYNPSGTSVTDLDAAALRNNGNSKYLILGAGSVSNGPSGLTTVTDGQLMVTVAKFDYTGTSAANERYLMTLQTLTTGRFFYRTYNGSWSSWYVVITGDASGNAVVPGDLAVNGGDITTNQTTASVFNATATTLNVGQDATTVSIGATTGTATIRNATTAITGAATVGGALAVTGDLAVNGGDITTTNTTASVFDTTATTLNVGGAATTLNVADDVITAQTINIGTGATGTGATKTINIGTGGAAGSTTNVNIGDADGGTVAVEKNMTVGGTFAVTGQTTLTGGLATQLARLNMASGSLLNLTIQSLAVTSTAQASGATRTFAYTPVSASSTIYVFPLYSTGLAYNDSGVDSFSGSSPSTYGSHYTFPAWAVGTASTGGNTANYSMSLAVTATGGGTINSIGATTTGTTTSDSSWAAFAPMALAFSQANTSTAVRTYTITATVGHTSGTAPTKAVWFPGVVYVIAEVAS